LDYTAANDLMALPVSMP